MVCVKNVCLVISCFRVLLFHFSCQSYSYDSCIIYAYIRIILLYIGIMGSVLERGWSVLCSSLSISATKSDLQYTYRYPCHNCNSLVDDISTYIAILSVKKGDLDRQLGNHQLLVLASGQGNQTCSKSLYLYDYIYAL